MESLMINSLSQSVTIDLSFDQETNPDSFGVNILNNVVEKLREQQENITSTFNTKQQELNKQLKSYRTRNEEHKKIIRDNKEKIKNITTSRDGQNDKLENTTKKISELREEIGKLKNAQETLEQIIGISHQSNWKSNIILTQTKTELSDIATRVQQAVDNFIQEKMKIAKKMENLETKIQKLRGDVQELENEQAQQDANCKTLTEETSEISKLINFNITKIRELNEAGRTLTTEHKLAIKSIAQRIESLVRNISTLKGTSSEEENKSNSNCVLHPYRSPLDVSTVPSTLLLPSSHSSPSNSSSSSRVTPKRKQPDLSTARVSPKKPRRSPPSSSLSSSSSSSSSSSCTPSKINLASEIVLARQKIYFYSPYNTEPLPIDQIPQEPTINFTKNSLHALLMQDTCGIEEVKKILTRKPEALNTVINGWSPLHIVALKKDLSFIKDFLNIPNLNVQAKLDNRWTVLQLIASNCALNTEKVYAVIKPLSTKVSINDPEEAPPGHIASYRGNHHILKALLDLKISPIQLDGNGWAMIHYAVLAPNNYALQIIVAHARGDNTYQHNVGAGTIINQQIAKNTPLAGNTAFMIAAACRSRKKMDILFQSHCVELNLKDADERDAYTHCCEPFIPDYCQMSDVDVTELSTWIFECGVDDPDLLPA